MSEKPQEVKKSPRLVRHPSNTSCTDSHKMSEALKRIPSEKDPFKVVRLSCIARGGSGLLSLSSLIRHKLPNWNLAQLTYDEFHGAISEFGLTAEVSRQLFDACIMEKEDPEKTAPEKDDSEKAAPEKDDSEKAAPEKEDPEKAALEKEDPEKAAGEKAASEKPAVMRMPVFLDKVRETFDMNLMIHTVEDLFSKLDKPNCGWIGFDIIRSKFNLSSNSHYLAGDKTREQVLLEVLGPFNKYCLTPNRILKEEFIDFYVGYGEFHDSRNHFYSALQKAYKC